MKIEIDESENDTGLNLMTIIRQRVIKMLKWSNKSRITKIYFLKHLCVLSLPYNLEQ